MMKVDKPTTGRESYKRDEFLHTHLKKVSEIHEVKQQQMEGEPLSEEQLVKNLAFLQKANNIRNIMGNRRIVNSRNQ